MTIMIIIKEQEEIQQNNIDFFGSLLVPTNLPSRAYGLDSRKEQIRLKVRVAAVSSCFVVE